MQTSIMLVVLGILVGVLLHMTYASIVRTKPKIQQ